MELTFSPKNDFKTLQSYLKDHQVLHQEAVNSKSFLLKCVEANRPEMVELLLKNGLKLSLGIMEFPLHEASRNGSCDVIKILLKFSDTINAQDNFGNTSLHISAEELHYDCVELLLDSGAKVELENSHGNSALHLAACGGDYEVIRILLENGCNHSLENRMKETPLHLLVENENLEDTKPIMLLLEHGASLSARY